MLGFCRSGGKGFLPGCMGPGYGAPREGFAGALSRCCPLGGMRVELEDEGHTRVCVVDDLFNRS